MAQFPEHFYWGVATASYQIEGAVNEGGRGESIWDRFSSVPGNVLNNETGRVADDHYHRFREDVQIMQQLGVNAYRFSIAWPRIMPTGKGKVNTIGLDFYDRLVDTLLGANIEPFITLYHWDLPQALQDAVGGWGSRETAYAFADYVEAVSRRLGDRVHHWITLNEPWVAAFMGNETGEHAPGLRNSKLAWQVSHNLLLGHALAVPILRANGGAGTEVGITLSMSPIYPASDKVEDVESARMIDAKNNRWFLEPVFRGSYPEDMLEYLDEHQLTPHMEENDQQLIAQPLDFLGLNYYFRVIVRRKPNGGPFDTEQVQPQGEYTDMGWEVYPPGLRELLLRMHNEYHIPRLYVTENGAAFLDVVSGDDLVHDARRIEYLREHFHEALAAISEGVPLAGYFVWSLMDNFEWAQGYSKRFGLVYIDYPTQRRVLKDSARWYRDFIASNGSEL
ncbi:MAG TPA: GH1 family beta-glucosidase [Ktedonobacteraceae bacterium]|nr:GH1 family beta-glucosidase [Ktedonobacteraceae bacterium]